MYSIFRKLPILAFAAALVATPAIAAEETAKSGAEKAGEEQTQPRDPQVVAKQTVAAVLSHLQKHRQAYRKNKEKLYAMIREVLLPHVDVDYMAQLVLGRYWRTATPEQRKHFTELFTRMVIRTYGNALLAFDNEEIKYMPVTPEEAADGDITFRAKVITEQGKAVPVTLDMHLVNGMWKVYDASVGSLSFVTSYRTQFSAVIGAAGLDTLIMKLEQRYGKELSVNQDGAQSS